MTDIALNCVALDHRRPIGVERFARNVLGASDFGDRSLRCLVRNGVERVADVLGRDFVTRHQRLERKGIVVGGTVSRILLEMLVLPFFTRNADVVLSINNFGPLWGKRGQRRLVVVHDVWFMSESYEGGDLARRVFRLLLGLQLRCSSGIITVSEFSRREICRHFGIDAASITVVGNCLGHRVDAASPRDGDGPPRLLLVGSARRNKNVLRALAGFQAFLEMQPDSPLRLVVVGSYPADWIADARRRFPELASRVDWRGFVDDAELDDLYDTSRGLIFVSLYEGFGIPAMEALLRGRPVLLARGTATAEIVGDLGITVDATDPVAIGHGIDQLMGTELDTDGTAFHEFRARYMSCDGAAARLVTRVVGR